MLGWRLKGGVVCDCIVLLFDVSDIVVGAGFVFLLFCGIDIGERLAIRD